MIYAVNLWNNSKELNRDTMFTIASPQPVLIETVEEDSDKVLHNGKYYTFNEDVFSVLFMGIDVTAEEQFADIGVTAISRIP